jgi:hypothetical protein
MTSANAHNQKSITATFNCGWSDASFPMYQKYFSTLKLDNPWKSYAITFYSQNTFHVGNLKNDEKMPVNISIDYYIVNSFLVGFWYPTSNYCDFDLCKEYLQKLHPTAATCNDANIGNVLGHIDKLDENKEGNKVKSGDIVGIVDCGSKFVVNVCVEFIKGEYRNRARKYGKYYNDKMTSGNYFMLEDDKGVSFTVMTMTKEVNGVRYLLWYNSGSVGSIDGGKKFIAEKYPDVVHYDVAEYDTFLKKTVGDNKMDTL